MHVFISGPYSHGDVCLNVRAAVHAADILLAAGHWPYVPHLTHLWHIISPHEYETWLALDLAWLEKCDALLRLPGHSPGADRETARAVQLGLPVFLTIPDLLRAA